MPKGKLSRRTFLQLATAAAAGAALPESMLGVVRPAAAGAAAPLGAQFIGKLEGSEIIRDVAKFPKKFAEAPMLAELVKAGKLPGLLQMFQMVNEARIEVGIGATAIASAAYYAALEYSKKRLQGRKLSSKDPTVPQIPIIEHPDVKRMLLFQRSVVEGALALLM